VTEPTEVPVVNEISLSEIRENASAFSPRLYRRPRIDAEATKQLDELLDSQRPFEKGVEPGSASYVASSPRRLLRTKALKSFSFLPYPGGDAIVPVVPSKAPDAGLENGAVLLCKDSNVGEVCVTIGDEWRDHAFSSGIVRLHPVENPWYVLAFIKHPIFRAQLEGMTPRGSTIAHAGDRWKRCLIPFPTHRRDQVVNYVGQLVQAIVGKERAIRTKAALIHSLLDSELMAGSVPLFAYPDVGEIRERGRIDAAVYDRRYREVADRLKAYPRGTRTPSELGFTVFPGPTLEIKVIKTRIDASEPRPGFYALLLPKNLSEFGTINRLQWLGTPKSLPLLHRGDVLIGEAGFGKGRSVVLTQEIEKCTTNAHGLFARREDADLSAAIVFRSVFSWYRHRGLVDLMAVGGSGGHLSPSYFDEYVQVPNLPSQLTAQLVRLYLTGESGVQLRQVGLAELEEARNPDLGIADLDAEVRGLRTELARVQGDIIAGRNVEMP
jgi:type I restriction enzyme S subunit